MQLKLDLHILCFLRPITVKSMQYFKIIVYFFLILQPTKLVEYIQKESPCFCSLWKSLG